jgi:predicted Zn-dependent protease
MPRRVFVALLGLLLSLRGALSGSARAQDKPPAQRLVVIRDAETETLLRKFADPLFRAANLSAGLVRIVLLQDRAINAFVSTGNRMFIDTGLIQQAGSALEVIGTIAHETGHVAHGDISRLPEMAHDALLQTLGSLLIAAAAGAAARDGSVAMGAAMGGANMAERRFLSFNRAQETAADQAALRYLDQLGWSSRGLLALFGKLEQEEALLIDRQDPYLVSHPLTPERMAMVRRHVAESPYGNAMLPPALELGFRMVQAKLDGFLDNPGSVLRKYPETDRSAPARYARAVAQHRLGHNDAAVALLDGLLREQPGNPWLHELKGQILFEAGQGRAALAPYTEAVRLAPDQPLIRQSLARVMVETGDKSLLRPAIEQLQVAQARERDDSETWHLLGVAWGRLGNLGEANLALAEAAMLENDIPAARRFAREAAKALPQGPSRLRALDISNAVKKENRS